MLHFIGNHWKGRIDLVISFWVTFVALGLAYHFLEPYVLRPFADRPLMFIGATVVYTILTRLMIFPWQVMGVLRAADQHYQKFGRTIVLYSVQAVVIVSLVVTVSHILTLAQTLTAYKEQKDFDTANNNSATYELTLANNGELLVLKGVFDFGVVTAVEKILSSNTTIQAVVLESDGGQIYEGRGLGALFDRYQLDTYSFEACRSSCATAFMGGKKRFLGRDAKLGFHQYSLQADKHRQFTQFYDVEAEQETDKKWYQSRNIDEAFVKKIFHASHDEMWYPSPVELLNSGTINAVVKQSDILKAP